MTAVAYLCQSMNKFALEPLMETTIPSRDVIGCLFMDIHESLLRAVLATAARNVFPANELLKIVAPTGKESKQLAAYNLCDGNTSQSTIGKKLKIDPGSLSRSISRWIDAGIVFRIGPDQFPLHAYPLSAHRPNTRSAVR